MTIDLGNGLYVTLVAYNPTDMSVTVIQTNVGAGTGGEPITIVFSPAVTLQFVLSLLNQG